MKTPLTVMFSPLCARISGRLRHRLPGGTALRCYTITGNPKADKTLEDLTGGRAEHIIRWYEDFVGLTGVREAQDKVIEAEKRFLSLQSARHESQLKMTDVQSRLKHVRTQLMSVHRGDERFIPLVTEEDGIIKEENVLKNELNAFEKMERNTFAELSAAVRESHEKERARTERTKYWSVFGSLLGVVLGVIGTSVNNYRRMKELRGLVKDSSAGGTEMRTLVAQLADTIGSQQAHMSHIIADLKNETPSSDKIDKSKVSETKDTQHTDKTLQQLVLHTEEILNNLKKQDETMITEMTNLKDLLGIEGAIRTDESVVYVGPQIEMLLSNTEQNVDQKLRHNTLWTVTLVYAGFAVTLPILYSIFKGGT